MDEFGPERVKIEYELDRSNLKDAFWLFIEKWHKKDVVEGYRDMINFLTEHDNTRGDTAS